jgi:hypothetical protein
VPFGSDKLFELTLFADKSVFFAGLVGLSSLNFCCSAAWIKECTMFSGISSFLQLDTELLDIDITVFMSPPSPSSPLDCFKDPC